MQNWLVIDEEYLNYLRKKEYRIPKSDYGVNKLKPFFGALFEKDDLLYVTQISHAQKKHEKMRNSPDFVKIYIKDKKNANKDRLVAVINLNYMFPVPKSLLHELEYKDIDKHRSFGSEKEKSQYIDLLTKELSQINSLKIDIKAKALYDRKNKFPDDKVSLRCVEFCELENLAKKY